MTNTGDPVRPERRKSPRGPKRAAVHVDPMDNRPPNADEESPETLVPDIVRPDLNERPTHQREALIAQRAYELARERGFAPGAELEDWLRAEREIDAQPDKPVAPEDQFTG